MKLVNWFGVAMATAFSPLAAFAQFGAATGEIRLNSAAQYEVGGVPTMDEETVTVPVVFSMSSTPISADSSTPEANGLVFVTVLFEPSRIIASGSSNANAWCDAPLESCGSQSQNALSLSFALPHGGSYVIQLGEAFVEELLSAQVVIRDGGGAEVLRIEDDRVTNVSGTLAPGDYTIEAESVAVGEGEVPPHVGGYAAWNLSFAISPFPPACLGDADADGAVNFADVTSVLASFGVIGAISRPGDADGSGVVEFADVTAVLANFGTACE